MKKALAVLLVLIMIPMLFYGCQSSPKQEPSGDVTSSQSSAPDASSAAVKSDFDPLKYSGQEVVFSCLDTTIYKKFDSLLPKLEKDTGIKLTIDYIPENAYITKMQVVNSSQTGEYDASYANAKMYPGWFASGWVQPLDDYLNDPTKTFPDFKYDDFIPGLTQDLKYNDKIMAIPWESESNILYYNKNMFAEAGLTTPPKTMEEVAEYAKKLHNPAAGHAGIAMLGTRESGVNGFTWIMQWFALGGNWKPEGKEPYTVLADEPAINATKLWTNLLTNYAPEGIANYGWNELYLSMQQEKVAMIIATTSDYPELADPSKSKVADHLGCACIKGMGDKYTIGNISTWIMSSAGKNKDATWVAMQYMTSEASQKSMVTEQDFVGVTRQSVMDSDEFAKQFDPEWAAAAKEAYQHAIMEYSPAIPQGPQIREYLGIALSKCLSGQATPEAAMKEANDNVVKLLAKNK